MQLNRRRFLLGAAVAASAVASGLRVQARQVSFGPIARLEPVSETFYGQPVVDPYRWMENPADPDWLPWLHANHAHARATLEALPDRAALRARMRELNSEMVRTSLPSERGARSFFLRQAPDEATAVCVLREAGRNRVVIDPRALVEPGQSADLTWWAVAPDGRHVAFGLAIGGSESSVLHVLDVDADALLPVRIERCHAPGANWLPDSSGFFYEKLGDQPLGSVDYRADATARLHRLDADPAEDRIILARDLYPEVRIDRHDSIEVWTTPDSPWVVAETSTLASKGVWVARLDEVLNGPATWKEIYSPDSDAPQCYLRGDKVWAIGSVGGDESAVLELDVSGSTPSQTVLAIFTGGLVEDMAMTQQGLFVSVGGDGHSQLFFVPPAGEAQEITLPRQGAITGLTYGEGRKTVLVSLSTWLEPPSIWRMSRRATPERVNLVPEPPPPDTRAYSATLVFAAARDGVRVPMTILAPRDLPRNGSAPCMVYAYGAYGVSQSADFDRFALPLLERGGISVIAHVRGGGERGYPWWEAGRGATKPNTWRDLIDCCEHLINQGWTSSDRLGILGGSAGGIAVGRAMTERPDLFALVFAGAGVLNPMRFEFESNGLANIPEFGSIATEDGFRALYEMDTLHHISNGVRYPPIILTHGVNDSRVAPWHTAKTAARLRAVATPDSGPVLFKVNFNGGHLVTSPEREGEDRADVYAWLLDLMRQRRA